MGFEIVAIARGQEKVDFAKELGAHHYIDSTASTSVAAALQSLGAPRPYWPLRAIRPSTAATA
ncbi:zinc-binding dehydrogenase [Streptomyces sp. NPDC003233]